VPEEIPPWVCHRVATVAALIVRRSPVSTLDLGDRDHPGLPRDELVLDRERSNQAMATFRLTQYAELIAV